VQFEFSRREQQIMDIIYRLGKATAKDVGEYLPKPLANATIRTQLRILENKGAIKHYRQGKVFIYEPVVPRSNAAKRALTKVLDTFFAGSVENALAAHLADSKSEISTEELRRLRELIDSHEPREQE
jgi:predicted transcriptional regulator